MALFQKKKAEEQQVENGTGITLESVISTAISIPGVRVDREAFLRTQFKGDEQLERIVELGPVAAGCDRETLQERACRLVKECTAVSTGASFLAGLPGGWAMAATIPADMAQFYGVALRLAQQLAYLYGEGDLWAGEMPDSEKVRNQLILYCGVMFGAAGAAQAVRVLSSSLAVKAGKAIAKKALTKTFFYPIVKSIAKAFGLSMTKGVLSKTVSKVIPVIGGVVSGGVTLATMYPMGMRLVKTLETAHFEYSHEALEADIRDVEQIGAAVEQEDADTVQALAETE